MADRHAGYIVALEKDIREGDAEQTLNAIRNIKRVIDVQPVVSEYNLHLSQMRVRSEIAKKFYDFYVNLTKEQ